MLIFSAYTLNSFSVEERVAYLKNILISILHTIIKHGFTLKGDISKMFGAEGLHCIYIQGIRS